MMFSFPFSHIDLIAVLKCLEVTNCKKKSDWKLKGRNECLKVMIDVQATGEFKTRYFVSVVCFLAQNLKVFQGRVNSCILDSKKQRI